jgi:quinoprotein glucose dehydrogenase
VALDLKTGKRKWHYQLVHHGMWDMDIPCAPVLVDITVNGRMVKAVAQPTKQAWLYVFDRATGQPVWPIVEQPVAKGDVPGEWYSPTQPFVTKPPAYDRQGVSADDLIDFTPELKADGLKLASLYKMGPIFTPPSVSKWEGPRGTLTLPSAVGGTNWPGGSVDPETGIFYVFSITTVTSLGLVPTPDPKLTDIGYIEGAAADPAAPGGGSVARGGEGGPNTSPTVQGIPLIKPPYGRITAIDLNKGDIVWQIAHGETPDNIRNHPALKGVTIPRTGRGGRIGTLVTKTLVVAGEGGGVFTLPDGRRGAMLRAYDKATGKEMGAVYMPAPQTGSPMTYMLNGQQYIVLAIGGGTYPSEFVAYKLPRS